MKYKLVTCDMDGTLLNSESLISQENEAAVKRLVQNGILFSICTGRSVQATEPFHRQLGLTTPIIAYNGARIVGADYRETLYEECLHPRDAAYILALGAELDVSMCIWSEDRLYMNKMTHTAERYVDLVFTTPIMFTPENPCFAGQKITKILWNDTPDKAAKLVKALEGKVPESVSCFTSTSEYIEFVDVKVSKGTGLLRLCERLGIAPEETVAIGDGENDIPMLRAAGFGVAMQSAGEKVRAAADYVTLINDENGVAAVLEKIMSEQ